METGYNISDYDPASLFKSYYVVWKLGGWCENSHGEMGLNRTMQYGNSCMCGMNGSTVAGLNRTMQYGNLSCFLTKGHQLGV